MVREVTFATVTGLNVKSALYVVSLTTQQNTNLKTCSYFDSVTH